MSQSNYPPGCSGPPNMSTKRETDIARLTIALGEAAGYMSRFVSSASVMQHHFSCPKAKSASGFDDPHKCNCWLSEIEMWLSTPKAERGREMVERLRKAENFEAAYKDAHDQAGDMQALARDVGVSLEESVWSAVPRLKAERDDLQQQIADARKALIEARKKEMVEHAAILAMVKDLKAECDALRKNLEESKRLHYQWFETANERWNKAISYRNERDDLRRKLDGLVEATYNLAMASLQSHRYAHNSEYANLVDIALAAAQDTPKGGE